MKRSGWKHLAQQEKHAIEMAGYSLWVEYPWHWVVSNYKSDIRVHVWPTVGKYMAYFDSGATTYRNKEELLKGIDRAFNPPTRIADDIGSATKDARDLFI